MPNSRPYSEQEMVEGCVRNERYFQELLYRKYFNTMMQMCLRYTDDRERALEIVNNGFLRVFKKLDKFSFKGSLEGWIRKLVFHCISEYFKKNSKYLQFLVLEEKERPHNGEALEKMYAEDILKMVDKLPPATQVVFRLYAIEGFTHVEIAKKVNISVGTSKWHLSNARKQLQQSLKKNNNYRLYAD